MKRLVCVLYIAFALQAAAFAENTQFQATLDKSKVRPGRQATLSLVFVDAKGIPALDIPPKDNITYTYIGSSEEKAAVGGRTADVTIHRYKVVPARTGRFQIGPLSFDYKGKTYASQPVFIDVSAETEKQEAPAPYASVSTADFSKRIFATLSISKPELYVNELATVTLKLYTDWMDVEVNTAQQAKIGFAITGGFTLGDAVTLRQDGVNYAVIQWSEWFYVPEAGAYTFDPIKMNATIMHKKKRDNPAQTLSNDNEAFYNGFLGSNDVRMITVASEPVGIKVLPLPAKGKPKDFRGAVGSFILDAAVDRTSVKIGDTVTLTVAVTGKGNYFTVTMPQMEKTEGFRAYEPQVQRDPSGVVFKQLLKIQSDTVTEIPRMTFSFFDPSVKEYMSLSKGPIALQVEKAPKKEAEKKPPEAVAANVIYIKESTGAIRGRPNPYFYRTRPFILMQILPLLVLGGVILVRKRMDIVMSDLPYARWLRATRRAAANIGHAEGLMARNNAKEFYGAIFKMMQDYFGERLNIPSVGITETTVAGIIKDKAVLNETADKIIGIFSECYLARYTSLELKREDMAKTLQKVKDVIGYLNKIKEL